MTSGKKLLTALTVSACLTMPSLADASVYVWQSKDQDFQFSVPDTWKMSHNQSADDMVTFIGPDIKSYPECIAKKRIDGRFLNYPYYLMDEVQKVHFSKKFWDEYVGIYDDAEITFIGQGGLGQATASFIHTEFTPAAGIEMRRKAIAFVTISKDNVYIMECSAEAGAFDRWRMPFFSVMKSAMFKDIHTNNINGHYRPAQDDADIIIRGRRDIDDFRY